MFVVAQQYFFFVLFLFLSQYFCSPNSIYKTKQKQKTNLLFFRPKSAFELKTNKPIETKTKTAGDRKLFRFTRRALASDESVANSQTRVTAIAGQWLELKCPLFTELVDGQNTNLSLVWRKGKFLIQTQKLQVLN